MPHLWEKNHSDYRNKSVRYEGYRVLSEIYKSFDPNATVKTIKKKLDNMRTTYTKEAKKVNVSKHTGAGSEDVYVPSLWYFDALKFLGSTTESCRPIKESLGNEGSSLSDEERSRAGPSGAISVSAKNKKNTILKKQENVLNSAEKLMSMKEEEWEVLGKSIGLQMRDLNQRELTIAQKLIADVIYYVKIGRLSVDAHIVLGSTPSPPLSNSTDRYSCSSPYNKINRIKLSSSSPQYYAQSPYPSPQYHVQSPQASP